MLKCLYAICYAPDRLPFALADLEGLAGAAVYAIPYQDIAAVVSDVDKPSLKPSQELALQYERLIERIMARYPLLPMRFGTLVKDERAVSAILQKDYAAFVNNLQHVQGKWEYGLKLLWEVSTLEEDAVTDARPPVPLNESSPYQKYLLEKFKAYQSEKALLQKAERIIARIHPPLKALSASSTAKKLITPKIIFDAAYLVATDQQETFIRKVQDLGAHEPAIKFLLTGPWPPYNFIEKLAEKK